MRKGVRACALGAVIAAMAPGVARADLTIDFESPLLGECGTVTNQFSGITLSASPPTFLRKTGVNHSGGQSLQTGGGVGCGEPDMQPHPVMVLSSTYASASIWVRQEGGSGSIGYQLQAFDTSGTRIDTNGSTFTPLAASTTTYTQLAAATADNTNRIARLELVPQANLPSANIRYDDLALVSGAGGNAPDFSLGPAPVLRVAQGGSAYVDIPINRVNGSTNRITDITTSPRPDGLTYLSAFSPPDLDVVRVSVNADGSATPGPRTVTVTATPSSAATGPAPRPVDVPITITETPPTISIVTPAEGLVLDRVPYDLEASGGFTSYRYRAGDTHVCAVVTQSATAPPTPSPCADQAISPSSPSQWHVTVDHGFAPGQNYLHAFIVDPGGYVAHATRAFQIAAPSSNIDLGITGMEVTQGPQRYTSAGGMAIPRSVGMNTIPYAGVQLVTRKAVWVRVFATTNRAARSDGRTPAVTARLRVTRGGVEIPGSPFLPANGPQDLAVGGPYATDADRRDITHGFLFELPPDAARGPLVLDATINDDTRPIAECATCGPNDELRMTGLTFRPMKTLHIYPIRFHDDTDPANAPMCDPPHETDRCPRTPQKDIVAEFARARAVYPFPIALHSWVADINITADQAAAQAGAAQWRRDHPHPAPGEGPPRNEGWIVHWPAEYERDYGTPSGAYIAVGRGSFSGMTWTTVYCCAPPRIKGVAVVEEQRPLTSVAHEYGHVLGLDHADRGPDAPAGADRGSNAYGCTGGTSSGPADGGWPDLRGTLVGFAFDTDNRVVLPAYGADGRAANYDFMSYCAATSDNNSWLSTRNWDRLVNEQNDGPATRSAGRAGPPGPGLAVTMRLGIDGGDGAVTSVTPVSSGVQADDPTGSYDVAVLGADGAVLSSTRVAAQTVHADAGGGSGRELLVAVTVPAGADPRAVELRKDGTVLAKREASAHAPVLRLLSPKPGTRIGRRGSISVRWKGTDADGDTLRYVVEEATSPNGKFRMVGAGYTGSSARIPVAMLAPSANARLRVRASDGFRETSATSGRLRIAQRPAEVSILAPQKGTRVRADAVLALEGQAVDATNAMVTDRALVWRDGHHVLGKGSMLSVTGLRPGTRTLSLRAKGGVARVRIKVTPVVPRLLTLGAPAKLGPTARTLALKLAASVPSRLTIKGGKGTTRAQLGRRTKTVIVHVKPGSAALKLTLLLKGGGKTATIPLTLARG